MGKLRWFLPVYDESDRNHFDWTRRLPHALDDDRSGHLVATNRVAAEKLFNAVADTMKARKLEMDEEDNFGAVSMPLPYYLFVIAQPAFLGRNDSITEYLFRNKQFNAGASHCGEHDAASQGMQPHHRG